jgi:hypothetical protein
VITANTADVGSTKPAHVTATAKSTDVATATTEATHMAPAKAAAHMAATTTASASAGLCTRGKQAAGKHRACQDHHHSSSHDILHYDWRTFAPQGLVRRWRASAK